MIILGLKHINHNHLSEEHLNITKRLNSYVSRKDLSLQTYQIKKYSVKVPTDSDLPVVSTMTFLKTNLNIKCIIERFTVEGFFDLFDALRIAFKYDTRMNPQSVRAYFVFYAAFFAMLDSKFFSYLVGLNSTVMIPTFVSAILFRLVREVKSPNKFSGYTTGEMLTSYNFKSVLKSLVFELRRDNSIFLQHQNSVLFSRITDVPQLLNKIAMDLEIYIKELDQLSEKQIFGQIVLGLSGINNYLSDGDATLSVDFSKVDFVNWKLELYRFNNISIEGINYYSVNQTSISKVDQFILELFGAFLSYFKPRFITAQNNSIRDTIIAGEVMVDTSTVSALQCANTFVQAQPTFLYSGDSSIKDKKNINKSNSKTLNNKGGTSLTKAAASDTTSELNNIELQKKTYSTSSYPTKLNLTVTRNFEVYNKFGRIKFVNIFDVIRQEREVSNYNLISRYTDSS